ncbi:hypothetical protein NQ318_018673 [Aromia moschata]|uniref:Uncharacterized protein n=1 Tax=Aromia moschata TaxID=1265417 RepID=A0AAV8ZHZ0_9CUCU|nr:hypothetical protein NQ318_018673 [Aromia moschata]
MFRRCIRQYHEGDIRIMNKRGRLNLHLIKIPEKSIRYASDLWNTLVNMKWRWLLPVIALVNVAAYLVFALLFLLDAWVSGDFDDEPGHRMCVTGMHNFTSYFMLGIETITTTGYGYFHPTEFCYLVFVILTCSTMVTFFIDGAFMSVVYAKFGRVKYQHSLFSRKAVINLRNGKLCLIVRINDSLLKHWIDNTVKMFMVVNRTSPEGEVLPNFITELEVEPYGMLFWPIEIIHAITSSSPFWEISAKDLMISQFEVITIISGSSIQTGQLTRTQTSYLSEEILWGYRFCPCLEDNTIKSGYIVNRKSFNATVSVETPLCSASVLAKLQKEIGVPNRRNSLDDNCS